MARLAGTVAAALALLLAPTTPGAAAWVQSAGDGSLEFSAPLSVGAVGSSRGLTVGSGGVLSLEGGGSAVGGVATVASVDVEDVIVIGEAATAVSVPGVLSVEDGAASFGDPWGGFEQSCSFLDAGAMGASPTSNGDLFVCNGREWVNYRTGAPMVTPAIGTAGSPGLSCADIRAKTHATESGPFFVRPTGQPPREVWCDMETDGGGWTLVMRQLNDLRVNATAVGEIDPTSLFSNDTVSAKLSDAFIRAINRFRDQRMTFRITSARSTSRYFAPGDCVFRHTAGDPSQLGDACRRFAATYDPSPSPTYTQCSPWGGGGGGLDFWYGCDGTPGNPTNVAVTHRQVGGTVAEIADNTAGTLFGTAEAAYGNDVLLWVR